MWFRAQTGFTLRADVGAGAPLSVERSDVCSCRWERTPGRADVGARDEAWAALGFLFGLLRRSELGALKLKDIILEQAAGRLRILIRRSKTDPGHGQSVWIAWRTESGVNIANIVKRWVDARTANGASPEDALFTAWNKKEDGVPRHASEPRRGSTPRGTQPSSGGARAAARCGASRRQWKSAGGGGYR